MSDKIDPMLLLAGKFPPPRKRARVEPPAAESEATVPPSDAQPVGRTRKAPPPVAVKFSTVPISMSLVERCREVICANIERFPPAILGVLDPHEWDALITLRHTKTKPLRGTQGLDGTGRLTPAVSEKFISAVEDASPYLVTPLTDVLVWKDCVNYRFRSGGMTRPNILQVPWPNRVEYIQSLGKVLEEKKSETPHETIQALRDAPMSVLLLQATGIGKTVKKAIKAISKQGTYDNDFNHSHLELLKQLLQEWKAMADSSTKQKDQEDWELAETIHSWKELYAGLKDREEKRRSELGQKMRQNRASLDKGRPAIVKVRPMKRHHELILNGQSAHAAGPVMSHMLNPKLQKLRQETAALAQRTSKSAATGKTSFARAVSVAACAKRKAQMAGVSSSRAKQMMKTAPPSSLPSRGGYKPQKTKPASHHKPAF